MDVAKFLADRLCEIAGGAVGKCDPEHCVCGGEGRELAKAIEASGYAIVPKDDLVAKN